MNTKPKPATKKGRTSSKVPPKSRKLTVRQERFCELIAAGKSGPDAWIEAGYEVKNRDVARANAAESLAKPSVAARVAELRKPQTRKTMLTRDKKRELLAEIALSGGLKPQDRIRAMEVDAKLAGHFEPDRVEVETGPKTLQSIKERAAQVSSALVRRYTQNPPQSTGQ